MSRKIITLLIAILLLIVFVTGSALAVPTNTINLSGKISFKGKIKTYSVTYHTNGGEGSAPVDSNHYSATDSVIVLGQGSMKAPAGKSFAGWAAVANASAATELPGKTINIGANLDLYAVWLAIPSVTATYYYKDSTGTVQSVSKTYVNGETVMLPTLTELGWKLEDKCGFVGWGTTYGDSSLGVPGSTKVLNADIAFYGQAVSGEGRMEFPITITWDDADNHDGVRPYPDDVISQIVLNPKQSDDSYVSAITTTGNYWTIVWSNLEYKPKYSVVVPEVEGYTKKSSSANSLTFKRSVSDAVLSMWISNKKWDKKGELIKFKVGQDVKFRMDVTNVGNETLSNVVVYQSLKGAKFVKASGYSIKDGGASIGNLGAGKTVSVFAVYRVTSSDVRKDKVVNSASVEFNRKDGSWSYSWDAVRIPISKKVQVTVTATPRPTPTPTPIPVIEYMVEKLLKDTSGLMLSYPDATIDVIGAEEMMTPEEYAVYQTLTTQDKILTVLNSIGFDALIPAERLRLNLTVSEPALGLMNTIYARKQVMTAEERTIQQTKESIYFPRQSVVENGIMQNYFEIGLRIRAANIDRIDRYTFREEPNGQWNFVRVVVEQ